MLLQFAQKYSKGTGDCSISQSQRTERRPLRCLSQGADLGVASLATAYERQGNMSGSLRLLEKACREDPYADEDNQILVQLRRLEGK